MLIFILNKNKICVFKNFFIEKKISFWVIVVIGFSAELSCCCIFHHSNSNQMNACSEGRFFFSFLRSAKDIFIEWCVCGCDSKTYGLYHEILWWWLWWVHNYKLKIGISIGESVCLHLFNHIYRERENEELEKLVAKKKTQMSVLVLVFVLILFRSSSSWLDVSRFFFKQGILHSFRITVWRLCKQKSESREFLPKTKSPYTQMILFGWFSLLRVCFFVYINIYSWPKFCWKSTKEKKWPTITNQ